MINILTSCSIPQYSPSVFSLIVMTSTSSYFVLNPSILLAGRTLANKLKVYYSIKKKYIFNKLSKKKKKKKEYLKRIISYLT